MEFYVVLLLVAAAFADSDKYYHIAPQTHLIHNQQIPTLYQSVQTPTYYKLDDDDVEDVDDDNKYLYTFPQTHQVTPVQYSHINTQLPVQHVTPVQYSQFHTLVKPVKHIRNTRSAESTEGIEVKKTDSHFLNLLTTKPETTPLMQHFKSSGHLFQQTPVINTHFQNIQPYQIKLDESIESGEFVASKFGLINPVFRQNVLPVQTPFIQTPIFRTLATPLVQKPVSQVGTHLIHQTKQVLPPVHTEAIEVVAPKTNLINPVFTQKSGLIQNVLPVFAPKTGLIQTVNPIYTPYMQKKLDVEDIINPVQYTTLNQFPQQYTTLNQFPQQYTTLNQYPIHMVNQPIHMVNQPIYKQMDAQMVQPGYVLAHQGSLLEGSLEQSSEDAIEVSH